MTALFCVDPETVVCQNALPCVALDSCGPQETFYMTFEGGRKQHHIHFTLGRLEPSARQDRGLHAPPLTAGSLAVSLAASRPQLPQLLVLPHQAPLWALCWSAPAAPAGQPPCPSGRPGSSERPTWVPAHQGGLQPITAVPSLCFLSPISCLSLFLITSPADLGLQHPTQKQELYINTFFFLFFLFFLYINS